MSELDTVLNALRKADAAGNTEDAKKLAAIARRLSESPRPSQKENSLGPMPFVNKAIAESVGAPVDLLTKGLNLIPGVDIKEPFGGSESLKKGMGAIGVKLPEEGQEPQSIPEHIGRGVGEVASFMVPSGAATKFVSKGTGIAGKVASDIMKAMGKHPYLTIASEVSAGAGAGIGRGATAIETDSPAIQSGAELIGGIAGGMAPYAAPTVLLRRFGMPIVRKFSVPFTKSGQKYRAGEHLKGMVVDPNAAVKTLNEPTIGDLPASIQVGEKKIATLYKSLLGQDPVADSDAIEEISKSIIKLENEMRKMGYGSPEALAEMTRKRVAAIEMSMDNRVVNAMEAAENKLNALPVANRKVAESRVVRSELEAVMTAERLKTKELWDEVPKEFAVGVDNIRERFASIKDGLSQAQNVDIPSSLKNNSIITDENLTSTTLKEMQGLRSKLLEVARIARKDGQWNKARIAEDVSDAILMDLGIVAHQSATPEAAALQAALASTRQFKTRFESGIAGKILGYDRTGAPAISPDLTLDISIGRMGEKGSIDIGKVVVTPEARKATERYLARSYTDHAMGKNSVIDPIKSERWIRTNEAILDEFPELRTKLSDIAGAQEVAMKTKTVMEARKKTLRNPNISVSAKFLNAADLHLEIKTILKSPSPSKMMNQLVRQARKDPTGAAVEGLKAGMLDLALEQSTRGAFNELGEQTLSGRTLLNFISQNDTILRQVFSTNEILKMKQVGRELSKIESFNIVSAGKPDIEMKDVASSGLRLFARIGGARLGGKMGKDSPGGSLQMAQIYSSTAKKFVTRLTRDRAEEMIKDAILSKDPKLLQALLSPMDKPSTKADVIKYLGSQLNIWLAGTGKRVAEDLLKDELTEGEQ